MTDKLKEAIAVLKKHKHTTDKFKHSVGDAYVSDAIDTVVAHLNTENISELDENLDENVIEQSDNQEGISNNKDKDFPPELLKTYYPFIVEAEGLLKQYIPMGKLVMLKSIIVRCHNHGVEVGYEEALRFKELQK